MWNSLVQPHIDYCSQLWAPGEGGELQKIEKLLKDFTSKIPEISHMTYWERLAKMKLNSQQRKIERYRMICLKISLKHCLILENAALAKKKTHTHTHEPQPTGLIFIFPDISYFWNDVAFWCPKELKNYKWRLISSDVTIALSL